MAKKPERKITQEDTDAARRLKDIWEAYRRQHDHVSQAVVAEKLDMTQPAFSQFLLGKVAIGTNPLLKFARFFGVSPQDIRPEFKYAEPHQRVLELKTQDAPRMAYQLGISETALEVAYAFDLLPKARQHIVREYVFLEAVIARTMPWLIRGRPTTQSYDDFERAVINDYQSAASKKLEPQKT